MPDQIALIRELRNTITDSFLQGHITTSSLSDAVFTYDEPTLNYLRQLQVNGKPYESYSNDPDQIIQIKDFINLLYDLEQVDLKAPKFSGLLTQSPEAQGTTLSELPAFLTQLYQALRTVEKISSGLENTYSSELATALLYLSKTKSALISNIPTTQNLTFIGSLLGHAVKRMELPGSNNIFTYLGDFIPAFPEYSENAQIKLKKIAAENPEGIQLTDPVARKSLIEKTKKLAETIQNCNQNIIYLITNLYSLINQVNALWPELCKEGTQLSDTTQEPAFILLTWIKEKLLLPFFIQVDKLEIQLGLESGQISCLLMEKIKPWYKYLTEAAKKVIAFNEQGAHLLELDDAHFTQLRLAPIHQQIKTSKHISDLTDLTITAIDDYLAYLNYVKTHPGEVHYNFANLELCIHYENLKPYLSKLDNQFLQLIDQHLTAEPHWYSFITDLVSWPQTRNDPTIRNQEWSLSKLKTYLEQIKVDHDFQLNRNKRLFTSITSLPYTESDNVLAIPENANTSQNPVRPHHWIKHTQCSNQLKKLQSALDFGFLNSAFQKHLKSAKQGVPFPHVDELEPKTATLALTTELMNGNIFELIWPTISAPLADNEKKTNIPHQVLSYMRLKNLVYYVEQILLQMEQMNDREGQIPHMLHVVIASKYISAIQSITTKLKDDPICTDLVARAQALYSSLLNETQHFSQENTVEENENAVILKAVKILKMFPERISSNLSSFKDKHPELKKSAEAAFKKIEQLINNKNAGCLALFFDVFVAGSLMAELKADIDNLLKQTHRSAKENKEAIKTLLVTNIVLEADILEAKKGLKPGTLSKPVHAYMEALYRGLITPLTPDLNEQASLLCNHDDIMTTQRIAAAESRKSTAQNQCENASNEGLRATAMLDIQTADIQLNYFSAQIDEQTKTNRVVREEIFTAYFKTKTTELSKKKVGLHEHLPSLVNEYQSLMEKDLLQEKNKIFDYALATTQSIDLALEKKHKAFNEKHLKAYLKLDAINEAIYNMQMYVNQAESQWATKLSLFENQETIDRKKVILQGITKLSANQDLPIETRIINIQKYLHEQNGYSDLLKYKTYDNVCFASLLQSVLRLFEAVGLYTPSVFKNVDKLLNTIEKPSTRPEPFRFFAQSTRERVNTRIEELKVISPE